MQQHEWKTLQDAVWCLCESFEPKGQSEYESLRTIVNFAQMDPRDINPLSLTDNCLCEMMNKYECPTLYKEYDERTQQRETYYGWF